MSAVHRCDATGNVRIVRATQQIHFFILEWGATCCTWVDDDDGAMCIHLPGGFSRAGIATLFARTGHSQQDPGERGSEASCPGTMTASLPLLLLLLLGRYLPMHISF